MPQRNSKILIIDDDTSVTSALEAILPDEDYEVEVALDGATGLSLAEKKDFDAVLTDLQMPGMNGLELVGRLHRSRPRVPIIMVTAHGTAETAIKATQLGAFDYLLKPYEIPDLLDVLRKAVNTRRMSAGPLELGEDGQGKDAIVGRSRAMQEVYKEIGRFANKPVTVLIQGETGTGKELVARALFEYSDRNNKPFIAVNCAAIPENLLESELFGHERGAFTGADARRIGRFEQADGGTLFLDEVGDLSLGIQVKLLRVLQDKLIQRLGSKQTIPVDVRVISATHVDLEDAIRQKTFREDLYYRLNGVVLQLPALRDRREDIPALVRYFVRRYTQEFDLEKTAIKEEALSFLKSQDWPGNIRQLENVIRKAVLECEGYAVSVDALESILERPKKTTATPFSNDTVETDLDTLVGQVLAEVKAGKKPSALEPLMETLEKSLYRQAIQLAGGNQAKAARWVGVSRLTMREKLQKYGLHPGHH